MVEKIQPWSLTSRINPVDVLVDSIIARAIVLPCRDSVRCPPIELVARTVIFKSRKGDEPSCPDLVFVPFDIPNFLAEIE
jgi:hypothetical protein